MTKPNIAVEKEEEDTSVQPAAAEKTTEPEVKKEEADATAQPNASTVEKNEIDYEKELEKVTKERDNYKTGLLNEKAKNKVQEPAEEEAPDGYVTAEQLTRQIEDNLSTKFQAELDTTRKEMVADTVADTLESLTDNPDKQKLILWHYENSIKQSGISRQAIRKDLQRAELLADESRLARENSEMRAALKAKGSIQKPVTGSNESPLEGDEVDLKFTPAERNLIERNARKQGISFKEYVRRHKNQLNPN